MRRNRVSLGILLTILVALVLIFRGRRTQEFEYEEFKLENSSLQYTRHARCRMECRQISENEVREIIQQGKINRRKSDPADKPCPTYALEGYSSGDRQHIRGVVASCGDLTKVITCIDLDNEYSCNCK